MITFRALKPCHCYIQSVSFVTCSYVECAHISEVLLLKMIFKKRFVFRCRFMYNLNGKVIAPDSATASISLCLPINRSTEQHTMYTLIWALRKVLKFVSTSLGISSCCHFNSVVIIDCIFIIMFVFDIY